MRIILVTDDFPDSALLVNISPGATFPKTNFAVSCIGGQIFITDRSFYFGFEPFELFGPEGTQSQNCCSGTDC